MAKEKVNYQEVYDLYQLCSETKDLREFCADYGVNYDKFMNWQRHQLWSEKLGKAVQTEQPKVAKVQITGKPCNSPTVKMEVKNWKVGEVTADIGRYTIPEKRNSSRSEPVAQ
mgnify:CR=1 FL=1